MITKALIRLFVELRDYWIDASSCFSFQLLSGDYCQCSAVKELDKLTLNLLNLCY